MKKLTHIVFAVSGGGWVKAHWRRGGSEESAWLRFEPGGRKRKGLPQPRWVLVALQVKNPTAQRLADIPLARLKTAWNASAFEELGEELRDNLDRPMSADLDKEHQNLRQAQPRKKFKRPDGSPRDEAFLREVAFSYRDAVARGLNPGKTLAEDSGVPYSTVAKWIARTRETEKGYLPPAQQGKVTT